MLYLFLLCYDPTVPRDNDQPASRQPEHAALERELKAEGVFVCGGALMPPELAPRVIVRGGKPVTTGGPFAESRELVGGFYVIDCEDAEDAARQAARIPTDGACGWIEARHLPLFHADPEYIARMKGLG